MPEPVSVPHPPALKVGGRRCSVSNKPKPHNNAGNQPTEPAESEDAANGEPVPEDYPRPAPPGEGQANQHDAHHNHHDEEQPKRERRHSSNDKMKEYGHWKAEMTRPTRDAQGNTTKTWGAGGRIAQPEGKGFGL